MTDRYFDLTRPFNKAWQDREARIQSGEYILVYSQRLAGYGLDIVDQLWKEFGWYREALLCIRVDVAITPVSDGPG